MDNEPRRIVSVREAAKAVGVSEATVFRYIRLKLLDRYRRPTDARTYVDLDQLEELRANPPFYRAP